MTDFRETLTDMSLGIVDNVPPDQIPDNAVADALNMTFDKRQQLRSRPGCSVFNPHHNLLASLYNDFSLWSLTDVTRTGSLAGAPDGTSTATEFESTSNLGTATETFSALLDVTAGDLYTYDVWVRVATDPAEEGVAPSFIVEVDDTDVVFVVMPDDRPDAPYGWYVRNGITQTPAYSGVIGSVVDSADSDYTWYHVYATVACETTASGADLRVVLSPSTFEYRRQSGERSLFLGVSGSGDTASVRVWGQRFYLGRVLPSITSYVSTDAVIADNYLTDRVTSLYQHRNTGGTSAVYATSGSQLFEFDSTNKFFDDITGALALPDDTLWQWITFNGEAIGVNRSNTAAAKANPVVIPTPGGTPAALTGSPPKGRYIASFNDRVWIVDEDEPWKVAYSKLGDHEDWTDTGISAGAGELEIGGGQENFDITGLHVHQGVLIVFKRRSIYAIVPGSPNTDIRQYSVVELTQEIGCLSGYTVKSIVNDVVFLSSDGLTTLSLISRGGNYEAAFLSQNLEDFQDFDRGAAENAVATVCPVKSQYIISFRSPNATFNDRTYVFDYSRFQDGNVGFTRCDGAWLAQSFANIVDDSGGDCVLMGGKPENGVALVWVKDGNGNTFTDGGRVYEQIVTTKAYAPQDLFIRKKFQRWGLYLQLLTTPFEISVVVKTDLKGTSTKTYKLTETGQVVQGSRWDEAVWDTDTWGDSDFVDIVFTNRKFSPRSGSGFSPEGNLMQFSLSPKAGDGFVFRGLLITGDFLNDHQRGQA